MKQIGKGIASLEADVKRATADWDTMHGRHPEWEATAEALGESLPIVERKAQEATKALDSYYALVKKVENARKAKERAEKKLNEYKEDSDKRMKLAEQARNVAMTQLATAKGKTENLLSQLKEKKNALATALKVYNDAKAAAERLQGDMKTEVGDKDPDKYEAQLAEKVKQADNKVTAKTEEIAKLSNNLSALSGKMEACKKQSRSAEKTVGRRTDELSAWVAAYNEKNGENSMTVADIVSLYSATDNWERMRKCVQAKDDALTKAQTLLDKAPKEHAEHQATKPDASRDDLARRKAELEAQPDTELVEAKSRKQRYDHARQQMGIMHDRKMQAERTAGEWTAITDAIGTDGRTLRKIAQCYTLRFLIRDTTSLSGGETFIVSLGLALGLSALSSRNISFDNLFIDEGFGTLDPDTLSTVIDSLAMLQSSQGKKVGVISHTDTMSERITTQIRIIKNGSSGSSHIEVYP